MPCRNHRLGGPEVSSGRSIGGGGVFAILHILMGVESLLGTGLAVSRFVDLKNQVG